MAHPPAAAPIAFLSDVHGNLVALDVVLAELERLDVKRLYVAGDLLLDGDQPLEVWQRLQALGATCTRGPSDQSRLPRSIRAASFPSTKRNAARPVCLPKRGRQLATSSRSGFAAFRNNSGYRWSTAARS